MERRVGLERTRLRATEKEEAIAGIKELYIFTIFAGEGQDEWYVFPSNVGEDVKWSAQLGERSSRTLAW